MGGKGSGRKPKIEKKLENADALVQTAIKEYLQENAEVVDDEPKKKSESIDIKFSSGMSALITLILLSLSVLMLAAAYFLVMRA